MINPTFPLPGVFVPTHLIFHPELPAAVLVTWIQLRSLARDGRVTPPATLPELAAKLGIHPNRLNRHMAYLQNLCVLSWREAGRGKITLSFPDEPTIIPKEITRVEVKNLPILVSMNPDPPATSYFPSRILGYLSFDDDDKDPLYIENEPKNMKGEILQEAHRLPEFLTCKSAEHAIVEK